jgi:two-component system NtrC family sensor kinase
VENKSLTKTKKSNYITLSYSERVDAADIEVLLQSNNYLKLVKKEAQINLDFNSNNFIISYEDEKFLVNGNLLNLKNVVNGISNNHYQKSLFKEKKLKNYFPKKIKNKKYDEWSFIKKELKVISSKSTTLHQFPKYFLNSKFFYNFLSALIFVHEKGSKTVDCYSYDHNLGQSTATYSIENFNKLFTTIKKSKNKSFSLLTAQNFNLDFAGSFMGKEYSFTNNNAILLLSRNDFLTPEMEEIEQFDKFCNYLKPVIGELITSEKNYLKFKDILNTLEMFPLPIEVINKRNELLFSNPIAETSGKGDLLQKINGENFDLNIYFGLDNEQGTSDVFHFQRISLLGELLNTLKHELSNPLFGMYLTATLLKHSVSEENVEIVTEVQNSIERSQDIIENISTLYNSTSDKEDINIKNIFQDIFMISKSETKSVQRVFDTNNLNEQELIINTNPTWLSQILFNLIINSAQAMNSAGTPKPIISISIDREPDSLKILLADNGPGIKNVNPEEVFKPFFTTKKNGTGLGLNITKNLLAKLGGTIDYVSSVDSIGASFLIKLPIR